MFGYYKEMKEKIPFQCIITLSHQINKIQQRKGQNRCQNDLDLGKICLILEQACTNKRFNITYLLPNIADYLNTAHNYNARNT